ncbi:hypothetical protein MFIFM68171_05438 [Madurella fahalii]|uniref:F-box domain-containing protein n=1 Tax=Madurella fahalii TaxID=1157608 RepID=A0ABQ0GBS8_9PEZI
METTKVAPAGAAITSLPFDILTLILWDDALEPCDVKAMRLTCHSFSQLAATRLFYRIGISKLNTDRESFLSICDSPHLASHVRQLEWQEISYSTTTLKPCVAISGCSRSSVWLRNVPPGPGGVDRDSAELERRKAVAESYNTFQSAVEKLPNLHTFVSRPMCSSRIVADSGYPMEARLLQSHQCVTDLSTPPQTNSGLFSFLIPAMCRPNSTVTRLHWAVEFPGVSYLRPFPASAFDHLASIELCLTPSSEIDEELSSNLKAALTRAAPTLRHLKLCFDHGAPTESNPLAERLLYLSAEAATGFALQTLSLVSANIPAKKLV